LRCRTTDDLCRPACLMLVRPAILESRAFTGSRRSAQRGPTHHPIVRSPSTPHARQLYSLVRLARSGNCCIDCFVSESRALTIPRNRSLQVRKKIESHVQY
jgi:hypothetical protein